jgi:hypothetical protein
MQQYRYGALLAREIRNRAQPPVESQADPGKRNWHPEGERQNHTDRRTFTQNDKAFGDGVPNHGGHIPS